MNTYEEGALEADISAKCSIMYAWTVGELVEEYSEDEHGVDGTYPVSGDHLVRHLASHAKFNTKRAGAIRAAAVKQVADSWRSLTCSSLSM